MSPGRREIGTARRPRRGGPGSLDYLEIAASADPSRGTLLNQSVALETSAMALLGGDRTFPPGYEHEARRAALIALDEPTARALIAQGSSGRRISFEIDQIDDTFSTGWSVLVTGLAHRVEEPGEVEAVRALDVVAWAGGPREAFFRLEPETITARQLQSPR